MLPRLHHLTGRTSLRRTKDRSRPQHRSSLERLQALQTRIPGDLPANRTQFLTRRGPRARPAHRGRAAIATRVPAAARAISLRGAAHPPLPGRTTGRSPAPPQRGAQTRGGAELRAEVREGPHEAALGQRGSTPHPRPRAATAARPGVAVTGPTAGEAVRARDIPHKPAAARRLRPLERPHDLPGVPRPPYPS